MKYSEKYDLYIDDDLVIYYWDKKLDKLMQRTIHKNKSGYLYVCTKIGLKRVHRVIYETFVGPIPDDYEIDHIEGNKTDNRPEMLKCVTHKENCNNPITRNNHSKIQTGKITSEFGRKFKEHYGISCYQDPKLYHRERALFQYYKKCSWEK